MEKNVDKLTLTLCPNKPNCVSSQVTAGDKQHYIEALTYSDEPSQAGASLPA
jgi:uncharacterized protein (DUF1499 family)